MMITMRAMMMMMMINSGIMIIKSYINIVIILIKKINPRTPVSQLQWNPRYNEVPRYRKNCSL